MFKGILSSLTSSLSFVCLYYLVTILQPLSGFELLGIRTIAMVPVLIILISIMKNWSEVKDIISRVRKRPIFFLVPLFSALLVGFLQWLFFWAPPRGKGLDLTLGFFLMPLIMVVVGSVLYKEKITPLKGLAVLLASLGVINMIIQMKSFSLVAAAVALGYPVYFIFRKYFNINHLGGLFTDTILLIPVAIYLIYQGEHSLIGVVKENPSFYIRLPIFAIISTASLAFYILASSLLPMAIFGMMSYIEPVMLLGVALLLGAEMQDGQWPTYVFLIVALGVMAIEGLKNILLIRRVKKIKRIKEKLAQHQSKETNPLDETGS